MSCYFRHLKEIFKETGIEVSSENKKIIDHKIHQLLGVPYKNCSETWKKLKDALKDEKKREKLMEQLRALII